MELSPPHEEALEDPRLPTPPFETEQGIDLPPPPAEDTVQEHPPQFEYLDEAAPGNGETPPSSDESDSDPEETHPSEEDGGPGVTLEHMKLNRQFLQMIQEATLETQFTSADLALLRNPHELGFSPSDDLDLRLSIKFFISTLDHLTSQRGYVSAREDILERYPDSQMLSYDQVKRRVSNLSGVLTWKHDMCIDSCAAFTGPFAHLEECPICQQPRYDQEKLRKSNGKKRVPRKRFATIPLGPQLQARWRNPEMAKSMSYRREKTRDLLGKRTRGEDFIFDDILCGSDYLDAVEDGTIGPHDSVVMFSLDGAQLYRSKESDCWIYIWIILDLAPDQRYKVRNILPGGIIPGPKNPKHLDSFLFPGLAHTSALQKEGLRIWDGYNEATFVCFVYILLVLADAVAAADVSGSVGHHGRRGCRIFCGLYGRNKPGGPHYYPVLLRPADSNKDGSNHPDFDINNLPEVDPSLYQDNLSYVCESPNEAEYRRRRLETGIRKASIFDGVPRILRLPTCFPGDIMHQPVINLTALMFELWCGKGNCRDGDKSRDTWDWAVLKGDVWKTHGQAVAAAASFFPRSFDRTPRNPAKKLSSGYKAWEFLLYFYGLGPGLFYGLLPEEYYKHYCKLVVGIRIIYQREITSDQLRLAHQSLLEWVLDFELLYYRRKTDRMHFVRQCVHSLVHLAPETLRIGPPSLSAQWTMERMIGVFGSLIKQHSNPFANLVEQVKKVAEVNALIAVWPSLERLKKDPRGSIDIGADYTLLSPTDTHAYLLSTAENDALESFYSDPGPVLRRSVYRWGRLRLPTGQVARSCWKEVIRTSDGARTDRNVKVRDLISNSFNFTLTSLLL